MLTRAQELAMIVRGLEADIADRKAHVKQQEQLGIFERPRFSWFRTFQLETLRRFNHKLQYKYLLAKEKASPRMTREEAKVRHFDCYGVRCP